MAHNVITALLFPLHCYFNWITTILEILIFIGLGIILNQNNQKHLHHVF